MYVAQKHTQLVWRQARKTLAPRRLGELGANLALENPCPNPGHWAPSQLVIKALAPCPSLCHHLPQNLQSQVWGLFLLKGGCEDKQQREGLKNNQYKIGERQISGHG